MNVNIIAAMSPNGAIGYKGAIPWHVAEDLAHFKAVTFGHTVVMGSKTYFSLPNGALPGRRNIVLSRKLDSINGCEVCHSLPEALSRCKVDGEVFIIGGASVYEEALPIADKLYLTLISSNPLHADTFFPRMDLQDWEETKKEKHDGFSFIEFVRKRQ